jgi:hypothetical protein
MRHKLLWGILLAIALNASYVWMFWYKNGKNFRDTGLYIWVLLIALCLAFEVLWFIYVPAVP